METALDRYVHEKSHEYAIKSNKELLQKMVQIGMISPADASRCLRYVEDGSWHNQANDTDSSVPDPEI